MTLETFEEEDDSEFLDPLQIQEEKRSNPELEIEFKAVKRYRNHVSKALDRGVSLKQILPFRALAEIDEDRKDKIGLKELFLSYCENCNYSWLSPGKPFGVLEESLRKFQGDRKVLIPIVSLLTEISRSTLSPAAFLRYVILPRLKWDQNWRNWEKNHYSHFREIQRILLEIQKCPQFEKQTIGGESMHLARDIVLVKYIGLPLSNLEPKIVSNLDFYQNYISIWSKIELKNVLFFQFMKQAVLPFLVHFSSKLEGKHILNTIENLPELEVTFQEFYPDSVFKWKHLPFFQLYEKSFPHGKEERAKKGFKTFDFYKEIKGYTKLLLVALKSRAGIYLAEYLAKHIIIRKNPNLPEQFAELIELIPNEGGLYTYKWHIRKLLGMNLQERNLFLFQVRENRGLHPDFPPPFWLYEENQERKFEQSGLEEIATKLGLGSILEKEKDKASAKFLLQEYKKAHPESQTLLDSIQEGILFAKDRHFSQETIQNVDKLHPKLHQLILKSCIRGIMSHFSLWKSSTLKELWEEFQPVNDQPSIEFEYAFQMEETKAFSPDRVFEERIRSSINLELFSKLFQFLKEQTERTFSDFTALLGKEAIEIRKAKVSLEEEIQRIVYEEGSSPSKKVSGKEKSVEAMDSDLITINLILEKQESWTHEMRILVAIFYSSYKWDYKSEGLEVVFQLVLGFFKKDEEIGLKIKTLLDDVTPNSIQLYQVDALHSVLTQVSETFQNLPKVQSIWQGLKNHEREDFFQILERYSSVKKQSVHKGALDAALKKLFQLGKIAGEKSKWLDFVKKSEAEPIYRKFSFFSNKGFIDAYYGDMGGICLSNFPRNILRPNLFNFRLVDLKDNQIVGMFLLVHSTQTISSIGIPEFYSAFAINPLYSVLRNWSKKEKVVFYLNFRVVIEKISILTGTPIFLAGMDAPGLLSEGYELSELIRNLESTFQTPRVIDAYSTDIYYTKESYAKAFFAVDPKNEKTFHGHRLLRVRL